MIKLNTYLLNMNNLKYIVNFSVYNVILINSKIFILSLSNFVLLLKNGDNIYIFL